MLTKRSAHQKLSFFLFSIFSVFFTTVAVQLRCPRLHSRLQKRERTTHRACFSHFVFSIFHFQCFLYYSCCTGALLSTAQSVCKKESALARPTTPPHPHSVKRLLCFSKRHFAERHSVVLFLYASFSAVPSLFWCPCQVLRDTQGRRTGALAFFGAVRTWNRAVTCAL